MADYTPDYTTLAPVVKRDIRRWMRANAGDYENSTLLAEACGEALGLAGSPPHYVIPEDVYDIGLEFFADE